MKTNRIKPLLKAAIAVGIAVAVTGCNSMTFGSWPPARGGGMAEVAPPSRSHLVVASQATGKSQLYAQVHGAESALEALVARGADRFTPGDLTLARKLTYRIRREIAGDLLSEAETNMIELSDRLSVIDRRLNEIEIRMADFTTMS